MANAKSLGRCKSLRTAGFCITQRAGSALNLNPHFHSIFVDGAYRDDENGKLVFVATPTIEKKCALLRCERPLEPPAAEIIRLDGLRADAKIDARPKRPFGAL